MTYIVKNAIIYGLEVVVAMEQNPYMPAVEDIIVELEFVEAQVNESEKYYGVPFRNKQKEHIVSDDVKPFLEEFYFGERTRAYHLYRCRPLYRLVLEPLLDDMAALSHDEILDYTSSVIEQLKERALMFRKTNALKYDEAYERYQQMSCEHATDKKVKNIVSGIMKLRAKTAELMAQINAAREVVTQ